jgi:Ca2+-binding EF-hand superfamily protein
MVSSRWWGAIFLWVIMANTVTMALYRPTEGPDSDYNKNLELIEMIFLFIFTFELIMKLIGLQVEFFSDHWNNLDFVIVVSGYLVFLPGDLMNTSVFRTVRVLRPLRSIGMMPGVRILIDALIMSLPGLSTLLVLIAFVYAIFGVMGVQMFADMFIHHCVPAQECVSGAVAAAGGSASYLAEGYCLDAVGALATTCSIVSLTSQTVTDKTPAGATCDGTDWTGTKLECDAVGGICTRTAGQDAWENPGTCDGTGPLVNTNACSTAVTQSACDGNLCTWATPTGSCAQMDDSTDKLDSTAACDTAATAPSCDGGCKWTPFLSGVSKAVCDADAGYTCKCVAKPDADQVNAGATCAVNTNSDGCDFTLPAGGSATADNSDANCKAFSDSCTTFTSNYVGPAHGPTKCVAATVPGTIPVNQIFTGQFDFCMPEAFAAKYQHTAVGCDAGLTCVRGTESLHHDATTFKNFATANVVLFQIMTTEGWTTIFSPLLKVAPNPIVYIYFITLIFTTSFFMVNFVMAQMVVAFGRAEFAQNHLRPPELSSVELVWRTLRKMCGATSDLTTDVWGMRAEFNDVDWDESGELDEEEIAELATRLGMSLTLAEMDANGDGSIGYPEFEGWWRMRGMFDKFDADGSGALDRDEAAKLADKLGTELSMDEMDTDEDGSISYVEFAAWWNMRNKFNEYDVNGDQSLGPDEIQNLATDLAMELQISDLDKDGDGDITYAEFESWFQMRRAFTKLDSDGSGSLDTEEMGSLAKLLKMDLDLKVLDNDGSGSVDFQEFEVWWHNTGKYKKAEMRMLAAADNEYAASGLEGFVTSGVFSTVVLVVVLLNFGVLAMDHHKIDQGLLDIIDILNMTFTIFFTLEMLLKMVGLGLAQYFNDRFNGLDCFVVLVSLMEIILGNDGAFSALRTLRLLRTMKVFATSKAMRRLLEVTAKGGAAIMNFGVLLFFFIVIYALVGLHLFGDDFKSDVYHAPGRFDNSYWAFLTVFQVLTRENWHELLYVGYGVNGAPANAINWMLRSPPAHPRARPLTRADGARAQASRRSATSARSSS